MLGQNKKCTRPNPGSDTSVFMSSADTHELCQRDIRVHYCIEQEVGKFIIHLVLKLRKGISTNEELRNHLENLKEEDKNKPKSKQGEPDRRTHQLPERLLVKCRAAAAPGMRQDRRPDLALEEGSPMMPTRSPPASHESKWGRPKQVFCESSDFPHAVSTKFSRFST